MGGKLRVCSQGLLLERWKVQNVFQKDSEIKGPVERMKMLTWVLLMKRWVTSSLSE